MEHVNGQMMIGSKAKGVSGKVLDPLSNQKDPHKKVPTMVKHH